MATGYVLSNADGSVSGTQKYSTADVTAFAPTDAELDAAFGQPSALGAGFVGVINDAGAGIVGILCFTDGTNWFHVIGVKSL